LAATWIGGGYINGTAEAVFDSSRGLVWCQAPWCYALSLILGGVLFAGPMRRRGYRTMLDLFHERYGQRMAAYLYIPALVGDLFWTAAILAALGGTLGIMFDLDVSVVVILAAAVVIAYTVSGGLWSVAMSDVIQLTCIVGGLVAALPFVLAHCGGVSQMFGDYHEAVGARSRLFPEAAAWTGPDAWGWTWVDSALLLIFGGIPWQVYFQRVLASRSPRTAVKMSISAGFACLLIAFAPMLIGMSGVCLDWSSLGVDPPSEPALILPIVLRHAVPTVISLVGLTAIAAAVMSSVDSSILSSSSMFAWNVFRPLSGMDQRDPRLNLVLRSAIVILGSLAAILALRVSSVYQLWFFCADLVYVVLFPQLVMALFNRHATAMAAAIGATVAVALRGTIALLMWERFGQFAAIDDWIARIDLLPWRTMIMLTSLATIAAWSYLQRASRAAAEAGTET
jgi:high affinity choline transporter 7